MVTPIVEQERKQTTLVCEHCGQVVVADRRAPRKERASAMKSSPRPTPYRIIM